MSLVHKAKPLNSNFDLMKSLSQITSAKIINADHAWDGNVYSYTYDVTNYNTVYIFGLRVGDYNGSSSSIYLDGVVYGTYPSGTIKDYLEIDTTDKTTIKINIYTNYNTSYLGGIYGK